jgi:pentatricopeptide repeat protein
VVVTFSFLYSSFIASTSHSIHQKASLHPRRYYIHRIHSSLRLTGRKNLLDASRLVLEMIQDHHSPNLVTINKILSTYSYIACPEDGERFFRKIRFPSLPTADSRSKNIGDVITYSAIMKGYADRGDYQSCLRLNEEMTNRQIEPNAISYTTLVMAYANARLPKNAEGVFREMIEKGIIPTITSYNALINCFLSNQLPLDAFRLFVEVTSLSLSHDKSSVEQLPSSSRSPSPSSSPFLLPDMITYSHLFRLAANRPREFEQVLETMRRHSELTSTILPPTHNHYRKLIRSYCENIKPYRAHLTMNRLLSTGLLPPSVITYSELIQSFISYGKYSQIPSLLKESRAHQVPPNHITYETIIRGLCLKGEPRLGTEYHWEMTRAGFVPSEQCLGFILRAYSDKKEPDQAENFLHELVVSKSSNENCRQPNTACYQILVTGYVSSNQPLEAERVYREMKAKGMAVERHIYNILLRGFVRLGYVTAAEKIFREMLLEHETSLPPPSGATTPTIVERVSNSRETKTAMYNILLTGYLADYAIDDMLRIVQEMRSWSPGDGAPNEESHRLLMRYYDQVSQPEKVEEVRLRMENEGVSLS